MEEDYNTKIATVSEIRIENLKRRSGKCSKLILMLGLMALSLNIIITVIIKIFAAFRGHEMSILQTIDKDYINVFLGMVPCIIIDLIIIYIGLKMTKFKLKDIFQKKINSKEMVLLAMLSVGGVVCITTIFNGIYMFITKLFHITTPSPDFSFPKSVFLMIIYLLYVCLIGPIFEEIIFRGIVLNYLKKYGEITAIIFSSILFTMFHLNLVQFMTPLLLGFLLAFTALKTDSIKSSILIHIFNNTIATILSLIYKISFIFYGVLITFYIFAGLAALIFFINKYKSDLRDMLYKEKSFLPLYKKIFYCFSNFWSVVYSIFYVAYILLNFVIYNKIS